MWDIVLSLSEPVRGIYANILMWVQMESYLLTFVLVLMIIGISRVHKTNIAKHNRL